MVQSRLRFILCCPIVALLVFVGLLISAQHLRLTRLSASRTAISPAALPDGKKTTNNTQDQACSDKGWLLFGQCFCAPGWNGLKCEAAWDTPVPGCGDYNDACYFHPTYGVGVVGEDRWKGAQQAESKTWSDHSRKSDRQDEHARYFANWGSLVVGEHDLGDVLEIGCGPFTNTRTLLQRTGLKPRSITLVDPLIDEYMKTNPGCAYKDGSLEGHKTFFVRAGAETFDPAGRQYDTVILVNMIEHVQNAFVAYQQAWKAIRPGGLVIFHERFWQGYTGHGKDVKREFDLHPIRLNLFFAHKFSTQFDLIHEHEHEDARWGSQNEKALAYYWIGEHRHPGQINTTNLIHRNLKGHDRFLATNGYNSSNVYGNIFTLQDTTQTDEYIGYALQPWVSTVCEVGFAAGHSTIVWTGARKTIQVISFDDFGKEGVTKLAYNEVKTKKDVTMIRGNSVETVLKFAASNFPNVSCDLISIDGAHHAHFPKRDIFHLRLLANSRNVVLIDDFSSSWPAVLHGVAKAKGFLQHRHTTSSALKFRNSFKGWMVAQYQLVTIVVLGHQTERIGGIESIISCVLKSVVVQQIIVVWNGPTLPKQVSGFKNMQTKDSARVTVVKAATNSLNNRYDLSILPIRTEAVMVWDDDTQLTNQAIDCLFEAWKRDPASVYCIGKGIERVAKLGVYESSKKGHNFLLPRMMFHRRYLEVYFSERYRLVRQYVDEHPAHCDDIAFLAIVTKHTSRALVHVSARGLDVNLARDLNTSKLGLGTQANRTALRRECTDWIMTFLGNYTLPFVSNTTCGLSNVTNRNYL